MNLLLILISFVSVQAQQIIDQEDLLKDGLKNRAIAYSTRWSALLYQRYKQPKFSDVIKKYPKAVELLKQKQATNWDLSNPENFLSFGYNNMTDVYIRRYGFCSGYTYVTWVLRYLVTYDPAAPAQSTETMTKLLDQAIFELKPVTITGVAGLKSLSSISTIKYHLKLAIGRAWKEQSVGIDGFRVYLGKYQGKKTNWDSLTKKTQNYLNNGIYPILTAMDRNEWKTIGDMEEEGMIHVMAAMSYSPLDMSSELWTRVTEVDAFTKLELDGKFNQKPTLRLLNTMGDSEVMHFTFQPDNNQVDAIYPVNYVDFGGRVVGKGAYVVPDVYMDTIYYADRLAAQVALSLVKHQ